MPVADTDGYTLFRYENNGCGNFTHHYIQHNYPKERLERHVISAINGNGAWISQFRSSAKTTKPAMKKTASRNPPSLS